MIKFFRKIRQKLLSENKFTQYLIYALGEIFLVVIGILIALGINNLNEQRKKEDTETKLLQQLEQAIITDLEKVNNELIRIDSTVMLVKELDSLLNLSVPEPNNRLYHQLGTVYGMNYLKLNKALYEDLKASGLHVIRDQELRSMIINTYENDYADVAGIKELEQSINQVNRPYYLANFTSIRFTDYAVPNDLNMLWNDSYFKNIVHYRLVTLQGNQQVDYAKTKSGLETLLKAVRQNISS